MFLTLIGQRSLPENQFWNSCPAAGGGRGEGEREMRHGITEIEAGTYQSVFFFSYGGKEENEVPCTLQLVFRPPKGGLISLGRFSG